MAHVVTERCVDCRYTDCCAVCPVDCFYEIESPAMLVIDPDTCIDCALCVPECPIHAIWPEEELPEVYKGWVEKNAELFSDGTNIKVKTDALAGALPLDKIQAREKERGWTVKEPSQAGGAQQPAGAEAAAVAEAEPAESAQEKSTAQAGAAPKPSKASPKPAKAKTKIAIPEGLTDSQTKIFDATANSVYRWRTVLTLARQTQLPQGTVEGDLEHLVELGHLQKRQPDTDGVVVYGALSRVGDGAS